MKIMKVGIALLVALGLQTTLVGFTFGGNVRVDLVLVVIVYIALRAGPAVGLWTGTVGGITQDVLSGGIIGVGSLCKTLVGFLVGVAGSRFMFTKPTHCFMIFFGASMLHTIFFLGIYGILEFRFLNFSTTMVSEGLTNAVVGVVVFQLIEFGGIRDRLQMRHRGSGSVKRWLRGWI